MNLNLNLLRNNTLIEGVIASLLTALCLYVFHHTFAEVGPLTVDHRIHFTKVWLLKQQITTQGSWYGWTHKLLYGFPLNYTYPVTAYAFVLALHFLSAGLLSLKAAYVTAIVSTTALYTLAVYFLGRQIAGRTAGVVAALLALLDFGHFKVGGYFWHMIVGVWASYLALALFLIFLYFLIRTLTDDHWKTTGLAGLCLGLSILAHPIAGVISLVVCPTLLLTLVTQRHTEKPSLKHISIRLLVIYIGAFSISAAWILPYLSISYMTFPARSIWVSIAKLPELILQGRLLFLSIPLLYFGLLGTLLLSVSRNFDRRFIGLLTLLVAFVATSSFLDLTGLRQELGRFDYVRLTIFIRPLLAVGAGLLCCTIIYPYFFADSSAKQRQAPPAILSAAIIGLLLFSFAKAHFRRISNTMNFDRGALHPKWLDPLTEKLIEFTHDKDEFFRIFVDDSRKRNRWHPDIMALKDLATKLDRSVVFSTFLPTTNFRYKKPQVNTLGLKHLNVRYIVVPYRLRGRRIKLRASFGLWHIYELQNWISNPIQVLRGKGVVNLETFSDEEVTFSVNARSKGIIQVGVHPFPRWKAYHNGSPIRIGKKRVRGSRNVDVMYLPLKSGTYMLRFERGWPEYLGSATSLIGFALMLWLIIRPINTRTVNHSE